MSKVSVIVTNYNGRDFIIDCLRALDSQTFKDFEIILVDNGSSDNSLYEIRKFLEKNHLTNPVKIIPSDSNLGFAGGSLIGLGYTEAEYIALLNNDTEPDKRWLEELVMAMDSEPNVGICASKLIVYGSDIIDSAGDGFSALLKGFKRGEGENISLYDKKEYIFGACAGAALYRRTMLEEIGFFDEDFFLIHEDTDLNFHAQLAGWKVIYVPTALVHHKVRSSIGHMSNIAVYYTLRNNEFVRIKNIPLLILLQYFPLLIIGAIIDFIYFAIKHRQPALYFKAKLNVLRTLPRMLKKRAVIMRSRKVTNRYLISIMTPVWQKDFLKAKIKKLLYA